MGKLYEKTLWVVVPCKIKSHNQDITKTFEAAMDAQKSKALLLSIIITIFAFQFLAAPCSKAIPLQETNRDSLRNLIKIWKNKLIDDRTSQTVMVKLAEIYFQLDEEDSSEIWLNISGSLDEKNPEVYFWKGRIYLKKGKIGLIPLEKILAVLKQDNNSKAIKNFEKSIELRPDYLEAHYYLGMAHVQKGGNSHFEDAVLAYQYILNLHEDYLDTRYQLGVAFHKLKQYPKAISTFNSYYKKHPEDSRPFIELSRIYFQIENPIKASKFFLQGVVNLRDEKMLEELFLEIQDIANEDEKREYKNTPLSKKGYFFQKFWKSRDPTPITVENERFTEHFKRVMLARELYQSVIPPYYDHRGRIYVKYGPPDDRYVSNMLAAGTRDNESWSYEKSIQKGLVFDFMNRGGVYQLVQDLTEAAPLSMGYQNRLLLAYQMYSDRSPSLGGIYNKFTLGYNESYLIDFVNEKTSALQAAPTEVYHHEYKKESLPFQIRFAQFKGDQEKTKFEIYHSVLSKNLSFNPYTDNQIISNLLISAIIYDSLYNELDKVHYSTNLILPGKEQISYSANIDQIVFQLKPASNYHIIFQIENPEGNKLGIGKWNIGVKDFLSDSLLISDIELATRIEETPKEDQFYKNGLKIVPYTFGRYNLKTPLKFYYEIYNLTQDKEGKTKYQIDYQLTSLDRKESSVVKFFKSIGSLFKKSDKQSVVSSYTKEGAAPNENEYISIDIKNMPAGTGELTIIIKDLLTNRTTSSSLLLEFMKSGD